MTGMTTRLPGICRWEIRGKTDTELDSASSERGEMAANEDGRTLLCATPKSSTYHIRRPCLGPAITGNPTTRKRKNGVFGS